MNPRSHAEPAALPSAFGSVPFSEEDTYRIATQLKQQLGPEFVSTRQGPGGSGKLSYIEGWKVTNIANDIFGFNGWANKVVDITVDFVDVENGKVSTGISSIVRVTLKDGSYHEDVGYGCIDNARTKSAAFEKAKKESITDATKRALKHFGNSMGACLYNKDYCKKVARLPVQKPKDVNIDNLYRHEDFRSVRPQTFNRSAGMNNGSAAVPAAPLVKGEAMSFNVKASVNGKSGGVDSEAAAFGDDDDLMFESEFDVDEKYLQLPLQAPTPPQNMQYVLPMPMPVVFKRDGPFSRITITFREVKTPPGASNGQPSNGLGAGLVKGPQAGPPTEKSPSAARPGQLTVGGPHVNTIRAPTPVAMPGGQNKQPQSNMQSFTNNTPRPPQPPASTNNYQPPPRPFAAPPQPQSGLLAPENGAATRNPQLANMQRPLQVPNGLPQSGQNPAARNGQPANMQRPPQGTVSHQNQHQPQQQNQPQQNHHYQQQNQHPQRMQSTTGGHHPPQPLVAQRSAPCAFPGRQQQQPITPIGQQQQRPVGQQFDRSLQAANAQSMNTNGSKRPREGVDQQVGNAGSPILINNRTLANPTRPPDGGSIPGGAGNMNAGQAAATGYQYANRVTKRPRAEIPGFS
ncbi:DNA repair protein rad52 [Geranomyces michiganensis]|nr:DNA repair protein rad52 [Geranomyces michiganensis]